MNQSYGIYIRSHHFERVSIVLDVLQSIDNNIYAKALREKIQRACRPDEPVSITYVGKVGVRSSGAHKPHVYAHGRTQVSPTNPELLC